MSALSAAAGLSEAGLTIDAVDEALDQVASGLGGAPDLLVAFATPHHAPGRFGLPEHIARRWPHAVIAGCLAGGVLANEREIEARAAVSAFGLRGADLTLTPFHFDRSMLGSGDGDGDVANALEEALAGADPVGLLLFADPFTFDLAPFLPAVTAVLPGVPVFGGQASGGSQARLHDLFLRDKVARGGLVGVAIGGPLRVETRVSQGCRPVGPPFFVTAHQGNVILELDGTKPVDAVRDVYESLPPDDQARFRASQLIGIQSREKSEYGPGDFLVRHVLGVPSDGRGLAIAGQLERYAVVQFQVRDAESAHRDLLTCLEGVAPPKGAMLFTCLGRGRSLFGSANHDSRVFREEVGAVPVAGFFGNGEIGPVDGQAYLHGYTSVFAMFYPT